jgi:hypothetical protein
MRIIEPNGDSLMRGPSRFKLRDVARAIKAAIATGLDIARIEFATDGSFSVVAGKPTVASSEDETPEELRELL